MLQLASFQPNTYILAGALWTEHMQGLLGALPFQVLGDNAQSVQSPDVADGVAALVGWAVNGIGGAGTALVVRESSVGFQGMTNRKMEKPII